MLPKAVDADLLLHPQDSEGLAGLDALHTCYTLYNQIAASCWGRNTHGLNGNLNVLLPREKTRISLGFTHRSNWTEITSFSLSFFIFYRFLPMVMCRLVDSGDWWFEEKGNRLVWLAPGPATGINSRMEARAVMTPAQQGIHFSPSSQVPAKRRVSLATDAHPSVITPVVTGLPFSSCKHGHVTKLFMLLLKKKSEQGWWAGAGILSVMDHWWKCLQVLIPILLID